jgi:hypothetical protein
MQGGHSFEPSEGGSIPKGGPLPEYTTYLKRDLADGFHMSSGRFQSRLP